MSDKKQYVVVYAESDKGTLPMVYKNRPDSLKGILNLPGGKIEEKETPIKAALRELKEETGLDGMFAVQMGTVVGEKSEIHVIKVNVREKPLQPQEGETEVFEWFDKIKVYEHHKLMPNLRVILPLCYSDSKGWILHDNSSFSNWRGVKHYLALTLYPPINKVLEITVPGLSYYSEGYYEYAH